MAASLAAALPKARYTGEDEEIPAYAQQRGPRILGPGQIDESIVLRRTGPPAYGQRAGWRPRDDQDYGDGGAFPEIPIAQFPLQMGKKGSETNNNALAIQVDADGKVKYDAIARQVRHKCSATYLMRAGLTKITRGMPMAGSFTHLFGT